jgi:hypothetical protein
MVASLSRHSTHRVGKVPEIPEGLPFGEIEQGAIAEILRPGRLRVGEDGSKTSQYKK